MRNSMEVPSKIKNRTTIWSMNSTSGCLSEGNGNTKSKRYQYSHLHCSIIIKVKIWKQPKWPLISERIKMWHTHTHTGILTNHKIGNLAICNNVGGPWGHHGKWNKSDGERQVLRDPTYIWGINQTKQKQKTKLIDTRTDRWFPEGRGVGGLDKTGERDQKVQTCSYKISPGM